MSEFAVGEVAIYWRPGAPGHKWERTITSPLRVTDCWDPVTGRVVLGLQAYNVAFEGYPRCVAPPNCLRKRRPPQDWTHLCHLENLPITRVREPA